MTFPLSYFLYVYFGFLIIWGALGLAAIYHMVKFGFLNFTTFFSTFIFIGGTIIILSFSYNLIGQIDWNYNTSILQGLNFNLQIPASGF